MTIQQIYALAVTMGIKADPRGEAAVKRNLEKIKNEYEDLPAKKKRFFDLESLKNPYTDSRLLFGDPAKPVKKILAGIDANTTEVLLADRLNQKGEKIDLLLGHHPEGHALASLSDVMDLQIDVYAQIGVPVNVADALMSERIQDVKKRLHPINHNQTLDAARLLNMPLMVLHTIWDNLGDQYIKHYLSKRTFETVGDVYDYLLEIPEYIESTKGKAGPIIISGSERNRAGKVTVFFTGGTNPGKEMYAEMAKAGIGTIVDMHMTEDGIKEMKKMHVNVINAGHMASDSIGANLFLDILEEKGITIIPCSGLVRVRRS